MNRRMTMLRQSLCDSHYQYASTLHAGAKVVGPIYGGLALRSLRTRQATAAVDTGCNAAPTFWH